MQKLSMSKLAVTVTLLLAASTAASAETNVLKGAAADDFLARYFPNASIPGPFKATVRCDVPAMGARSNGAVSVCTLRY